jgi:hypothetical protein
MVAGVLLAMSSFLPAFSLVGRVTELAGGAPAPDPGAIAGFLDGVQRSVLLTMLQALGGAGLIVSGALLRRVGSHGLAGSGVVLDPRRARQDVQPWSELRGGVLRDTLDTAGLTPRGAELPFDEKLRRLHRSRQEGLISEEEYQRERGETLDRT